MIAKVLADLGCGFDCASLVEMESVSLSTLCPLPQSFYIVQTAGAGITRPEMVIYANTIKQRSFIREADRLGVHKMTFDNVEELYKIKETHTSPQLVLRIRADDKTAKVNLGIKFGCDPPMEKGPELLRTAKELGLSVVGISFHVGSGCGDATAYDRAISISAQLFDIGLQMGHSMRLLDLGGGFPGVDTGKTISFGEIADAINPALEKYFPEGKYKELSVIAEPGRYFGSAPVSLVAHVIGATKVPASRVTKKGGFGDGVGL